jgi:hypothetical protein
MFATSARSKWFILSFLACGGLGLGLSGNGLVWGLNAPKTSPKTPVKMSAVTAPPKTGNVPVPLQLEQKQFPQGTLYVLKVPANNKFKVQPFLSTALASIASPLWQSAGLGKSPVFLINGGFFDPKNSLTTSFVFQEGALVGDPRVNPQLVNNPKLVPYLPKIFNRSEFRSYLCQAKGNRVKTRYDIVPHSDPIPNQCLLQESLGAGPNLLPKLEDFTEGFVDYNPAGKLTRDPIGVCVRNARSVVGLTANGDVLLMMGAQNPGKPSGSGFSLADMAGLLKARGAQKAMALDGGSSSSFFFNGKAFYGKASQDGGWVKRPVKSVLMVVPQ